MTAPKWLTLVSVIALLWNLMGLGAIAYDSFADPVGLTAAQQQIVAATPMWAKAASWIAVLAGVIGSIGLLMKRSWAGAMFAISLVGVIGQYLWLVILSGSAGAFGNTLAIMQTVVLLIALSLLLLARHAARKGWLS